MCGRYVSARKRLELLEEFQVQADHVAEPLEPDYNVAPTKRVYAVLARAERSGDRAGEPGAAAGTARTDPPTWARPDPGNGGVTRQLRVLRWGLVPSWAKDVSLGSRLINARVETIAVKPAFRRAFALRRCLLPADGYYEWQALAGNGGRARKQPYFVCPRDGSVLAMAGLYELWRVPDVPQGDPDAWLWTATIITTKASDELGRIHDRMPMVVERAHWAQWLDPACTEADDLRDVMVPAASAALDAHLVSPAVNNVRNNGPGLIEPVPPGEDAGDAPGSLF